MAKKKATVPGSVALSAIIEKLKAQKSVYTSRLQWDRVGAIERAIGIVEAEAMKFNHAK